MNFEKISVVGLGYIGLPTAAMLATQKINVIGVDINQDTINIVNSGNIHIIEPGLEQIVQKAVSSGYLHATTKHQSADAFLIAVPTPFIEESKVKDKKADLGYIEAASKSLAPLLKIGDLIVLESTSPVGTTEKISEWLAEARPDLTFPHADGELSDIRIAYCPERVLPGNVLHELVENDRVIGGLTKKCSEAAESLYKIFVRGECLLTTARTAEMSKLTENSFRDLNIAFANELSVICSKLNINTWELISLANRHPRVNILQPGAGVGGHCIAVDPWFIVQSCPAESRLIRTARDVNDCKPEWVLNQLEVILKNIRVKNPGYTSRDITVACLGITFKPNIDDLRESPALMIAEGITNLDCNLQIVEPNIQLLPENLSNKNVELVSLDHSLMNADIFCILVKHNEFQKLVNKFDRKDNIIDVVGLLS
ncbi:UDP-N-acetyl-D-mannosamine dehydrogenase [Microbulbifer variabilis]|uniref:UDP-N-acetyl-D-mannosamine dehydrogenase n=1 Tax=Microbulbifer variabilis TaxID=266805 RepID=A0ABY4VG54_9GAMM|nr:UDP-N-acetyl-D-mannosamine dehydrogenase [Microbulbifer variabilis]USD22386.1 UDP-N-acetyl-D-mannosamine dehydrogenase [Microbulbifer variabilis]